MFDKLMDVCTSCINNKNSIVLDIVLLDDDKRTLHLVEKKDVESEYNYIVKNFKSFGDVLIFENIQIVNFAEVNIEAD